MIAIQINIIPPNVLEYVPILLPIILPRVNPKNVNIKLVMEKVIDEII